MTNVKDKRLKAFIASLVIGVGAQAFGAQIDPELAGHISEFILYALGIYVTGQSASDVPKYWQLAKNGQVGALRAADSVMDRGGIPEVGTNEE